jgi:uncharacterized repeat protein (TIGR04076 family)
MSKIVVTVVGGECQGSYHRIGDRWEIESLTPQGMCLGAWGSILPYVLRASPKKEKIHCPDPKGIILEIERIED